MIKEWLESNWKLLGNVNLKLPTPEDGGWFGKDIRLIRHVQIKKTTFWIKADILELVGTLSCTLHQASIFSDCF